MNGKNRLLVMDELVEFEKYLGEVQDFKEILHHFVLTVEHSMVMIFQACNAIFFISVLGATPNRIPHKCRCLD